MPLSVLTLILLTLLIHSLSFLHPLTLHSTSIRQSFLNTIKETKESKETLYPGHGNTTSTITMPGRRIYWIVALFFFVALLVSHKRSTNYNDVDLDRTWTPSPQQKQQQQQELQEQQQLQNKRPPPLGEYIVKPAAGSSSLDPTTPNTSRRYDTLVVIPSSWTQMQSRRWVRETVFGIRNNLEPCKKHDGRLIYKFYIHGRSTWLRTPMHTAQFMQAQVRDLYAEFMEFDDYYFANKTVTDRHTIWDEALDWAVSERTKTKT